MIRKLSNSDKEILYQFLSHKPSENLFLLWGIEAFGFTNEIQTFWGEYNKSNQLVGVLYKFKDKYTPYGIEGFDIERFASMISRDTSANLLAGIESIINQFKPFLSNRIVQSKSHYYAELKCTNKMNYNANPEVHIATSDDVNKIIQLYKQIPEFEGDNLDPENIVRNIKKGWSRNYYIEHDGHYVSAASTVCENRFSAMVSAVCTLQSYKQKGYASKCMENLILDLQTEGKNLCLFYDNPEAGKIYKRLGFQDIEKWSISTL